MRVRESWFAATDLWLAKGTSYWKQSWSVRDAEQVERVSLKGCGPDVLLEVDGAVAHATVFCVSVALSAMAQLGQQANCIVPPERLLDELPAPLTHVAARVPSRPAVDRNSVDGLCSAQRAA